MAGKDDYLDVTYTDDSDMNNLDVNQAFFDSDMNETMWKDHAQGDLKHNGATDLTTENLVELVLYALGTGGKKNISVSIFQRAVVTHSFEDIKSLISKILRAYSYAHRRHKLVFATLYFPPDKQQYWDKIRDLNEFIQHTNIRNLRLQLPIHKYLLKYTQGKALINLSCFSKTAEGYKLNESGASKIYKAVNTYHQNTFEVEYDLNKDIHPFKIPDKFDLTQHEEKREECTRKRDENAKKRGRDEKAQPSRSTKTKVDDLREKLPSKIDDLRDKLPMESQNTGQFHNRSFRIRVFSSPENHTKKSGAEPTKSSKSFGSPSKGEQMQSEPSKSSKSFESPSKGERMQTAKDQYAKAIEKSKQTPGKYGKATSAMIAGRMAGIDILEEQLDEHETRLNEKEEQLNLKADKLKAKEAELADREATLATTEKQVANERLCIRIEKWKIMTIPALERELEEERNIHGRLLEQRSNNPKDGYAYKKLKENIRITEMNMGHLNDIIDNKGQDDQ